MNTQPILGVDVEPEDVTWLWPTNLKEEEEGLIAGAMFNIVAGRPDKGKSMFATRVAADITRAGMNVLYSSKERSFGLTEQPRFRAAGGDLRRIHFWRFSLPGQFSELADHVIEHDIKLIVMDPVGAHFTVNTGGDQIREVLNPFVELCEATGCAVLFIEHALKRVPKDSDPLSAIRGNSSGIPAACAMGFLWGNDPGDENAKILACVKHNIREKPKALRFEVDTAEVEGVKKEQPFLLFDDETVIEPLRLLGVGNSESKVGRPGDKRAAAAEWLTNYLAEAPAPVKAATVQEDAKQFGMTSRTLRRAAADMGIVKNPPGGGPSCTWALPDEILEMLKDDDDEAIKAKGDEIADTLTDDDISKLLGDLEEGE